MTARYEKSTYTIPKALDGRRKLSDAAKAEIRSNPLGLKNADLAKIYGVSPPAISYILDPEKRKKYLTTRKDKKAAAGVTDSDAKKQRKVEIIRKWRAKRRSLFHQNLLEKRP